VKEGSVGGKEGQEGESGGGGSEGEKGGRESQEEGKHEEQHHVYLCVNLVKRRHDYIHVKPQEEHMIDRVKQSHSQQVRAKLCHSATSILCMGLDNETTRWRRRLHKYPHPQ